MKTRLVNKTCAIPKCNNTRAFKAVKNCYKHRGDDGDMTAKDVAMKKRILKDIKKMEEDPYDFMSHKQIGRVS